MVRHPFENIGFPALPPRPRKAAVTSVLDKGAGPHEITDVIAVAGQWIDVVKLGWASARLTSPDALRDKLRHYREAGIRVCTGGTFLEIALAQGTIAPFLESAKALGIDMIEVSNGIHPMSEDDKLGLIERVRAAGFAVWSEVGRKDPTEDASMRIDDRIAACQRELAAGAEKVVLEGRESGTVGIYDRRGEPEEELLDRIAGDVGLGNLVFEAPRKAQQVWMIRHFGPHVNLGNVPLAEALPLATLRTGLRSDTFADVHLPGIDVYVELGVDGAVRARDRGGVVIMIDALRASATIVTALASGMASVKVVATVEACVGDVTAGERGGKKLANLDHGNSPTELLRNDYQGRQLVLTSTNGAEVLVTAAGEGTDILVGTTLNARAVAAAATRIAKERSVPITLLQAGRNNAPAREDALAANAIFRAMQGAHLHGTLPTAPALEAAFFASDSGKNLVHLGYSEDVRFCAQLDLYDVVPHLAGGVLVPLS